MFDDSPLSRVRLWKLIAQLVKNYQLLWKQKFHYHIHQSRPIETVLSQMNTGHAVISSFSVEWITKKDPSLSVNINKSFISNKRITNIMLYLKSCLVVIKEC
jgi:hypothetical protein